MNSVLSMVLFRTVFVTSVLAAIGIFAHVPVHAHCGLFQQQKVARKGSSTYQNTAEFGLAAFISKDGRLDRHIDREKRRFETAVKEHLSPEDGEQLMLTLEGLRFTDHVHVVEDLIKFFLSPRRGQLLKSKLYNRYNENEDPSDRTFRNVREARLYLKDHPEPGKNRLKKVHAIAMQGGVEGIQKKELGRFRDYDVQGDHTEYPITRSERNAIEKNVYLQFSVTQVDGDHVYGTIEYVGISTASKECLNLIRVTHPELVRNIESFQSTPDSFNEASQARMTEDLLEALVQERYEAFDRKVKELGALNSPFKVLKYVKMVALHYRDLISIHPFADGNGRALRLEALHEPLDRFGIPKPRLNDPDRDVLAPPSKWEREVERGVTSNYFLYADMILRIQMGLPLENSVELLFPAVPRTVGIREKDKRKNTLNNQRLQLIQVDPAQFAAYFRSRIQTDPNLKENIAWDPILTFEALREEYKEFLRRTNFYFTPESGTRELVSAPLIDPDFYSSFGDAWSRDPDRYRMKMDRWYRDQITWRGMGYGDFQIDDAYILRMFTRMSDHSIAEGLRDEIPEKPYLKQNKAKMTRLVHAQFDAFNEALIGEHLWRMLQDQVSESGEYDFSIGFSTSKSWGTGRKYAWMGEVENEDGSTGWEVNQGTRVLVGARSARHEIEMERFGVVDGRFSYRIVREDGTSIPVNRQKEIMGVGAVDPDAIQVVQLIDEKGNPTESYVRDQRDPSQVLKVKGRWSPDDGSPPAGKVIETFSLDSYYY